MLASWLEIRSDSTILVRTGRTEIGTGMSAFYSQMIAEELNVRPESITLIMGDTDKTPDGGYSAGFLTGAANLRKVAAYTYQALLDLAATQLGVPVSASYRYRWHCVGRRKEHQLRTACAGSAARSEDSGLRVSPRRLLRGRDSMTGSTGQAWMDWWWRETRR